ncbi:putative glutaminyl-tRNA synthase (glutamine-hydrolyzing) [Helianthus annuus]|nr:putative glutaminyl-tRNA synthase (glutamine-hydrolyzing) [Helianthus annuus]
MLSSVQNPRILLLHCRRSKPLHHHYAKSIHATPLAPPFPHRYPPLRSKPSKNPSFPVRKQPVNSPKNFSTVYALPNPSDEIDRKIDRNEDVGPLAGVLVAVKDNICTADMPSTAGSKLLENYRPAFDATAVKKLKESGAIIVGKTNLDEFGMGSTTEGSAYQVTANPWNLECVPGDHQAARRRLFPLGSPTYGRVSRYGLVAYASSLDVIGCFGSSVADAGLLLQSICGHDKLDATSSKREVNDFTSQVGVISETLGDGVDQEVVSSIRGAISHLEDLGCSVTEVSLPSFSLGLPAYYVLASSESSSNLSRYDGVRYGNQIVSDELSSLYGGSRANGFGPEEDFDGTYALSAGYYDAYYKRAQQVRTVVQKSFKAALDSHDILISPAAPSAAYKIGNYQFTHYDHLSNHM